MQLRNMLTQLAICYLAILFCTTVVQAKENPKKPKTGGNSSVFAGEFVCGVYKGSDKELLWHYYQYLAKMKSLKKSGGILPSRDFIFDDVAVIEDDDSVLISGTNLFDTDMQTFHFEPNANNGYNATSTTFNFDAVFGSNLNLGDDANVTINLPFTFNYYGMDWMDVHVNANGIISFGGDINTSTGAFFDADFLNELPKIAPYFMDLNPDEGGDVFSKSESSQLTITWNQIAEFDTNNLNTIQLVLHSDNTFDVSFNGITTKKQINDRPIVFGIHPGGEMPNPESISFSDELPYIGQAGSFIFESYFDIQVPIVTAPGLMQKFYQTFPDSFFQVIYFTNFIQDLGNPNALAFEATIKNSIQGIGEEIGDGSQSFGSNGVLESYCNMNRLSIWRSNPEERFFTDGNNFLTILAQESGHRWGVHVNFIDTNGDTSDLILGRDNGHWSYYFDSDHSSLEGGNWEFSFGNTFTTPTQVDFFGDIDEYIMGLRTPEEVTPSFFVSSPTNDLLSSRERGTPRMGAFASGTAVEVTIGDIIAAEGPRLPAEADAPKDLRQAFILVIQNGTTPSQNELDKIANFRRTWEDYFERSVGGRMTLNTSITRIFPVAFLYGHVLDDMTDQPIVNITVESTERGFEQFVPGGGRYTFRYLADESSGAAETVTVIVEAEGYFPDTLTTNITYGTELVSDFRLQLDLTSVENVASEIPAFDLLEQNYPNPFNPSTTIKFDLSAASEVTLNIYNMKGQLVRRLLQEKLSAGSHSFTWDAKDDQSQQLPSGLYVSRLQAGDFVQHRKMLLIK